MKPPATKRTAATRSTPVPCEILRTVKALLRPRLRTAITTPS